MKIETFKLERTQSLYENLVDYNLTESDVHPFSLNELLTPDQIAQVLDQSLGYPQTNGIPELRSRIAALYPPADHDNVIVTNGSSEANYLTIWSLLNPGDELIFMVPNFMQIHGLAQSFGITVKKWALKQDLNWEPDVNELESLISPRTKMISVCNPNNPTGHIMSETTMDAIVALAQKNDLWLHCDEIYRGAEISKPETPTFYGKYNKVLISSGLSKAYALQGLRLGWLVGPKEVIYEAWRFSDYTTIACSMLSMQVAKMALEPQKRLEILGRNRAVLGINLHIISNFVAKHADLFSFVSPEAGGMVFIKYSFPMNSTELSDQFREEKSVFIVAGDCFGMDGYIRIGIGAPAEYLEKGLELFEEFLREHNILR
jgi:hypothetical protein